MTGWTVVVVHNDCKDLGYATEGTYKRVTQREYAWHKLYSVPTIRYINCAYGLDASFKRTPVTL